MASLSPPWYTYWNKVNTILTADSKVTVSDLDTTSTPFTITVTVTRAAQAQALANVLAPTQAFGGVTVNLTVQSGTTTYTPQAPADAAALVDDFKTAFAGNSLFVDVESRQASPFSSVVLVYPIFTRSVVQFYNDNMADYFAKYNGVTADAALGILNTHPGGIGVLPSTASSS